MSSTTGNEMRTRALIGLGFAVLIGIAGWIWLSRVMQGGVDRLAAIDRVRAECERAWSGARNHEETLSVDRIALSDTIDAKSDAALRRCGDLRSTKALPNPREMNGEPMPRGLR